ncbi:MAG: TolC family protein [Bacteroidales bacterium]|nr:TolC family protein [Bacteroidales bacterium]
MDIMSFRFHRIVKPGLFLIILTFVQVVGAQGLDTLNLEFCYKRAEEVYPLRKDRALIKQSVEIRVESLKKGYLPQLELSGDMKYLSEVINMNKILPLPGYEIPSPPNDNYRISLALNQILYDGGMIRSKQNLEIIASQVDDKSLDVELYKIKEIINTLYFSILFLQVNDSLFYLSAKELDVKLKQAEAAVSNGAMLSSDKDVLKVEKINLDQQVLENKHNQLAVIAALEIYLDTVLSPEVALITPVVDLTFEGPVNRPEYAMFDAQKQKLELSKHLSMVRRRPVIMGYGEAGYGQPGLNPVNDGFAPFYIVGLKMKWNFLHWNNTKRENEILTIQQVKIENQRETFNKNLNMGLVKAKEGVLKMQEVLQKDDEIIELRKRIMLSSASKLDNGIIQPSDYIRDFNKYLLSQVEQNLHQLLLLQAKFDYLTLKGNTIGNKK